MDVTAKFGGADIWWNRMAPHASVKVKWLSTVLYVYLVMTAYSRPLSVHTNLSKLFENFVYDRLQKFCQSLIFLAQNQLSFRKNQSTDLAALSLLEKLLNFTQRVKISYTFLSRSVCLFLILCPARFYLRSWKDMAHFSNRSQFGWHDSVKSCIKNQDLGVIQGSETSLNSNDIAVILPACDLETKKYCMRIVPYLCTGLRVTS